MGFNTLKNWKKIKICASESSQSWAQIMRGFIINKSSYTNFFKFQISLICIKTKDTLEECLYSKIFKKRIIFKVFYKTNDEDKYKEVTIVLSNKSERPSI